MKRHFLCRAASVFMAVILAAESSMTVLAAQTFTGQGENPSKGAVMSQDISDGEPEGEAAEEESFYFDAGADSGTGENQESGEGLDTAEGAGVNPGTGSDGGAGVNPGSGLDKSPEAEVSSGADKGPGADAGFDADAEAGTDEEPESGTDPGTVSGNGTGSGTVSGNGSNPGGGTVSGNGTEPEPSTPPETETETETVPEEGALPAPQIIKPVSVTESGIVSFTWNAVEGAEGYYVYRKTGTDGKWGKCAGKGVTQEDTNGKVWRFTDSYAKLGELYYYKVQGYGITEEGSEEEGSFSEIVDNRIEIEGIAFGDEEVSIMATEQKQLTLVFTPVNATRKGVIWTSSDTEVATVSEDGTVTALKEGKTQIQAKTEEKTAECTVTVTPKRVLVLNQQELQLKKGGKSKLEVVSGAEGLDITWTSSDTEVVTVENINGIGGVTAVGSGNAVITAQAGGVSAECKVTVKTPVSRVVLEKDSINLVKGGNSKEVIVNILPLDATDRTITCKSANEDLVTCSVADGKVVLTSGSRLGKTTVDITADGQTAVLTVNVVEEEFETDDTSDFVPVREVRLARQDGSSGKLIPLGQNEKVVKMDARVQKQLYVEVLPGNATNQNITWESSDERTAVVSDSGLLTAKGIGVAHITAKADNGICDKITVVVRSDVGEVKINEADLRLYCNADKEIFAGTSLAGRNKKSISMAEDGLSYVFRSSDSTIATVDSEGNVTAVAPGTAYIVALDEESGKSDSVQVTVERLIEEIKLPSKAITVVTGTEMKLEADVLPKDATTKYEWRLTSGEDEYAVLKTEPVRLKAKKAGDVTLSVRESVTRHELATLTVHITDSGKEAVTSKLTLQYDGKSSATINSGTKIKLTTSAYNSSGVDIGFTNEYGMQVRHVAYKSSNEKAATVDENGEITAIAGGTAKITATVLDGSNVSGVFTVKVTQRPEEIGFSRSEYVVAPKKSVTLKPTVLPANSKNKKVTWSIERYIDSSGSEMSESQAGTLIKVNKSGKVTVNQAAPLGMTAVVRCTSSAYDSKKEDMAVYKDVVVRVGTTKVTKLTLTKKSLELAGIGTEENLGFVAKGAAKETLFTWTSSDEKVVTVDQAGTVKVTGYGTAKVTLCADNALEAVCTVTANPIKKAHGIAAASGSYGIQRASNDGKGCVQLYFINTVTKTALDSSLLTFTSSNPEAVYVDEKGMAYANPKYTKNEDMDVTITAALKDDPLKRTAQTTVTVWKDKQVKTIDFQFFRGTGKKKTEVEGFNDRAEEKFKAGDQYTIVAVPYDADRKEMKKASLVFTVSDDTLASVAEDKTDKSGHTVIVTVKQPGRFKVTCMAMDRLHTSRSVAMGVYAGIPILKEGSLGTVYKAGTIEKVDGYDLVFGDKSFTLTGADGTKIVGSGDVEVDSAVMLDENGVRLDEISGANFRVKNEEEDGLKYRLGISYAALKSAKAGTYEITLTARRTSMDIENNVNPAREKIKTTFKISESVPKVTIANTTVNSFLKDNWTKLKITTKGEIEDVKITTYGGNTVTALEAYYKLEEMQDGWYLAIKEEKFEECKSKKIKGSFDVKLKGYEEPVAVTVTVTAKSTKPKLKQLNVPDILTSRGDTAFITIYDSTAKENLTDYEASFYIKKDSDWKKIKWDILNENVKEQMGVQLHSTSVSKAASYKHKVSIKKEGWREAVVMDITVKASPSSAKPNLTFEKSAFTLNTCAPEETYSVKAKTNKGNVTLRNGEWTIVNAAYADLFTASYQEGLLTVGLKPGAASRVTASKYVLQFKNVFEEGEYEAVKTAKLTVTVKKTAPAVGKIKFSGKLDLINRQNSTLTGTVNISGLSASIDTIDLVDGDEAGFTDNFYCVQNKNKFTVYARSKAVLTVKSYKGKVKVKLVNGTELEQEISFKTSQADPKLKTAATQTIYKSEETRVADYNLNKSMPAGVRIEEIVTRVLPAGLGVEYDNGHAYVAVGDDTIKAGTYTIAADVYFKGAQKISGSEHGKPVRLSFKVEIKE